MTRPNYIRSKICYKAEMLFCLLKCNCNGLVSRLAKPPNQRQQSGKYLTRNGSKLPLLAFGTRGIYIISGILIRNVILIFCYNTEKVFGRRNPIRQNRQHYPEKNRLRQTWNHQVPSGRNLLRKMSWEPFDVWLSIPTPGSKSTVSL